MCSNTLQLTLKNQSVNLQKQIQEVSKNAENYEVSLTVRSLQTFTYLSVKCSFMTCSALLQALSEQQDLEKIELLSQIQNLERELSCLSSSFMVKEKESLRKELDKTKQKLKETEFKLKTAIQEKTKLEVLNQ